MTSRARILVAEPKDFSPRALAILETELDVERRACSGTDELAQAFVEFDAVWIRLGHRIGPSVIGTAPRCRVLAANVTGLDHIDLEACSRHGIRVVSLKGEREFLDQIRATAEHAVALTLGLLRQIPPAAESVKKGEWKRDAFRGNELYEKVAGVVGVGRIGSRVAHYLRAFDMKVVGYDPDAASWPEDVSRCSTLAELVEQSDVVTLHVSYDPARPPVIGQAELVRMKPSAILVNTSRGGAVDESALLASLRAGRIAGAALDVLDGEPHVSKEHPLIEFARQSSKLLIVPHLGGNTWESFEKTEVFLAHKVVGVLSSSVPRCAS